MNNETLPEMPVETPVLRQEASPDMIRLLVAALSGRALTTAKAVLVFIMGCWAMVAPSLLRAEVAAGFAVFVLALTALRAWSER